jgi:hypothetical protein
MPKTREKCAVCNRKQGVTVQCCFVGCAAHFHPICGGRSGRGLIRIRGGERIAYCAEHIPEGVERLSSGYWVDGTELTRLRFTLDRARTLLDVLVRRERYKKMLCKVGVICPYAHMPICQYVIVIELKMRLFFSIPIWMDQIWSFHLCWEHTYANWSFC